MQRALEARIARLEGPQQLPAAFACNGGIMVIWDGPEDDGKLAMARQEAEASGKFLIVHRIVDPKEHSGHVG